jgi:hypothetical protein
MLKDSTYKEKFAMLKNWVPHIVDTVKKDLKNEHLRKDWNFTKQYFPAKNINKLTSQEILEAYSQALVHDERAEELGEFLSNRWLLKNTEIYHFFEAELSKVAPNFSEIEELDRKWSQMIMEEAIGKFGAPRTYLFCILNSVVFPQDILEELDRRAQHSVEEKELEEAARDEKASLDELRTSYERQIARLKDKYEKKMLGLEKKYHQDIESYKKQIAALQRKLNAAS